MTTTDAARNAAFTSGFYADPARDFVVRLTLGRCAFGGADAGEVLAAISQAPEGDDAAWARTWLTLGRRLAVSADESAQAGHFCSASNAYLRAAVYLANAVDAVEDLTDIDTRRPVFAEHRRAFDRFLETCMYPFVRLDIPYVNVDGSATTLPGYLVHPDGNDTATTTLVMINGSDGDLAALWCSGAAGALARGYSVLMFDGPGQQSMLFDRGIGFRPDWENVVTPVVDHLLGTARADQSRLAMYAISQAGFWGPRALSREHRFAAAIIDPGVVSILETWLANLPPFLVKIFQQGNREEFDAIMSDPRAGDSRVWDFRAYPYGVSGFYDVLDEVRKYQLGQADADAITTPMLVTSPEDEQFYPGQPERFVAMTQHQSTLVEFTAAEGANFHCQPMARLLTDERMFDWLDVKVGI